MDAFDNPARNGMTGPERDGASTEQSNRAVSGSEFLAAAANVTAAASTIPLAIQAILVPDASGRIVLPAGASIDDITISGTDLVITLPNGQVFIIPGGAVDVPAIVVDGDTVPASTVAQLLENLGELNPEAGVRSSGGNFADPEGPIQDAYALGDLLPYTQLAFPQPENRELLPAVQDAEPTIVIVTPDQPAGLTAATASVNEAGLPARGNEPAGSNSAANSETTTGSIVYDADDGLDTITINGTAITAVGQVITTPLGQLTITSLTPGNVGYSYTLTDNTNANSNLTDPFTIVVTDNDGDTATATLTVSVVDDVPTARADTDRVAAGSFAPETGNVLTGAGTISGAAGADTPGADGATLTGIRGGAGSEGSFSAPGTVQGLYGTLTINAQGGYTYVRAPGTTGGVNDVFTYRITDGDGDTSTATLTISIADAPTVITFVPGDGEGDGGTVVYEADLGPRAGETPGSAFAGGGSAASTSGTITFTAVDGIGSVSIGGVVVTPGSLPQTISSDATGKLVVTAYSYDPATGQGSVTYVYTLIDNMLDGDGTTLSFPLVITDTDGDAATDTLEIDIVDDVPTARADSDSVAEDSGNGDNPATADGNVLTGVGGNDANGTDGVADVQGADGARVTAVTGGVVGAPLAGAYGSLTLNGDGSYSYVLDNASQAVQGLAAGETLTETFTYTITDGDGDTSTTTLTITINGADDGITVDGLDAEGGEIIVDEDNLADGSSPDAAALTQGGTFDVSTPDGLGNVTIGGVQVVANGVFTAATVTSALGTVNITGFMPVTGADGSVIGGTFTYNYVLSDNTLTHGSAGEDSVTDSFAVVVTDSDGSTGNASLDVRIVDDVPTARADVDSVTEDSGNGDNPAVADGNVLTGLGGGDANATDGVADTQGADGAAVTAVAGGALGAPFAGAYGMLTLNSDGSYRYVLSNQAQAVQGLSAGETLTEVFTYTITDGDGDTSTATLTITINGADDGVTINGLNAEGAEVVVNEDDLSDGSSPDAAALTQTSSFSISTPDGLGNVTIGGVQVVTGGVFTAGTVTSPLGVINITGFSPVIGADGSVIGGTFTYNYVLSDNTLTHTSQGEDFVGDSFAVVVTDSDGSTTNASLDVRVIDDVPTAANDGATAAEDAPVVINVLANDVRGADGVDPVTGVALATAPAKGSVVYNGDGTFTYTPTAGQEGTDSFTYTITDGDGDTSTATVTVQLAKDSVPTVNLGADNSVDEAGLPAGSNAASNSETATGSFALTTGNDSVASLVINGVDVTAGGTVTTPTGVLTVTLSGGAYSYSYTLTTNTSGDNTFDSFTAVVTDSDGDTATDTLVIDIIDDVPTARADIDSVTEDGPLTANGNVLTGVGGNDANNTDGVADVQGADSATVTGLTGGSVGTPLVSAYGTLTLNADGSYSYVLNNANTAVQSLSAGQTLTEIFTYTITDGDGDPSTTTLTITINGANDGVTIGGLAVPGGEEIVNEDDLPDGSSPNAAALTQTGSFTVTAPDGLNNVTIGTAQVMTNGVFTPGLTTSSPLGTVTITGFTPVTAADGSVIGGTFSYSYTLADNTLTHPAAGEDTVSDSFAVIVTDSDGSSANASLDITVIDDIPTASAEPNQNVAEGTTVTGTLDFVQGADGATVTQINGTVLVFGGDGFSQTIDIGAGTIKVKADGSYSFTADAAVPGTGTASATYTVRDGDGDTSTAPINFTITDANAPTAGQTQASVDDDALAGGNPASTTGDLADSNSDGDNNQATFSGLLNLNFGGDGPGSVNFAAMNGLFAIVGQESVQFLWNAGTNTLTGTGPRGVLFTVEVTNPATGAYKVTLVDNVLHNPGGDENDATVVLGFTVSDSDGSTASGTLRITFDDDAPTVVANTTQPTLTVDESALGTDASFSFASVFTPTFGADGAAAVNSATYALGITAGSTGLVDTLTNQAVVLSVVGGVVQGRTAVSNELVFTVSVTANGTVTLDQIRAVVHTPNSGPDQPTSLLADNLITLTATVTDADGDAATAIANIGQNLVFEDDAPVANDDTAGLTEGGPISVTFDVDTNDSDGADGFGSRTFTSLTGTYGTITLNPDGTQTYTLNATGQAAIAALAPGATLTDVFTYTLTDKDGDSDPATLTVTLTGDDDGVTITNLTPAAQGGDVTVDEDDLPNGSSPNAAALTATGTFNISAPDGVANLSVHGTQVIANGVFTPATIVTPLGNTLNITAYNAVTGQLTYTYTLTGAETHATGADQNSLFENFAVSLTDTDGDNATGTLSVNIVDDVPTAANDSDSIAAGQLGPATGNVITDAAAGDAGDGDTGADTRGADGAAVSAIASVNVPANSDTTADGLGNFQVSGQYGVLTINTDGSYSYTRNAGTAGGVSDVFTYTLRDGDGDTATATLTISLTDAAPVTAANLTVLLDDDALPGGIAGGTGDDVNSQNTSGTLAGSGGDGALTFAFQTSGAPVGFTYELSGSNLLVKQGATTVLTVTLNSANGAYSVVQNAPIIHPAGLDENNQPFTLTYSVTDIDGDAATGTLGINVDDDTPTVSLTAANEASVFLTTQDAETIGAATDSAVSTANLGGVFTLTSGYGADGAGTTTLGYALALVGANGTDSTLDSNGASIFLYTGAGGTIVGSTSATAGGVNAGNTIFTLGVNATTGVVTLTQFAEIDHAPNSDTSAPYDDQFASLANGLVRLNGTATITDADGDSQTSTAFVDLGGNIRFADDGPSIAASTPLPTLTVDESNFGLNAVGSAVFTTNFGADGPGTVTYALGINAGSTGLVDTATGQNVVLTLVGGQVVATAGAGGPTVFTVAVDASGNITLDQIRAIAHDIDGGPGAAHDDAKTLAAANLITITGTITDGDGDSAQASINIGQRLTFKDDGPTATADTGTTTEASLDFNTAFVLDFSGSIDNNELNTMLSAVREAGLALFGSSSGNVSIRLIGFSSTAESLSFNGTDVFTDAVSFVQAIDSLNPATGGNRPFNGGTDFTAAIEELMDYYVPNPNASNQVFFLSDGNPNEQTGTGGNSLANATRADWINFVSNGGVNVTTIGVGNGITTARLQDVDVDGQGAPVLVDNFDDLVQTLLDIVVALPVSGNLKTNDNFGGDGGRLQSITINGTTYAWDGNNTITRTGTLTGNVTGNSITATTQEGATLTLNFDTGIWSYAPSATPMAGQFVFNYTVVDGDGDTASSTLTVTVADNGGSGGGNVANPDIVITNAIGSGAAIQIAEAALLANDQAGAVVTGAATNVTDATSVTRSGGNFTFTDNDLDGGSFFYSTTPTDKGRVTVNRAQAGETQLDGTSANDILVGRDMADTIIGKTGRDSSYGLGGNDIFNLANGDFAAGEHIDGGADVDSIILTGEATVNFATGTIVGVETLTGSAGNDNVTMTAQQWAAFSTINLAGGGDALTVNVSGSVDISAAAIASISSTETGNLSGSGGADTITLTGAQLDAILIGSGTINLGGGSDTIVLTSTSNDLNGLSDGSLSNVEAISAAGAAAGVKINLANQSEAFTLTGSGFADRLAGGTANDTLTGGGGADQFRFRSTTNGSDTVSDFADGTDKIGFLDTGATGSGSVNFGSTAGSTAGTQLNAADFVSRTAITSIASADDAKVILITTAQTNAEITGNVSANSNPLDSYVLVFNSTTGRGEIWYDTDWDSTAGRVKVATLNNVTTLAQLNQIGADDIVAYSSAADPIILDLAGDGYAFGASALFDMNADGVVDRVTWNSSNDGILAVDLDGNGTIDNGTEIFTPGFGGGNFANGTEALASLDDNGDGVIDAKDASFAKLLVWQDANADGVSDAGELSGLADHGITSIATGAAHADEMIDGQAVTARGSFTRADGSTGEYIEAQLDTQPGARGASREAEDIERVQGNHAIANALVAASLVAMVSEAQADTAAPLPVAAEEEPALAPAPASVAEAAPAALTETVTSTAGDGLAEIPNAAAPDHSTALPADDADVATLDEMQDSDWRAEPADDTDAGDGNALFDMVANHGSFDPGLMDGLLSLAVVPVETAAVGADAAAHDPAAVAVLAEVLESGDSAVDQLIHAVAGGPETVQIAAGEAPAFDLAQFLDQKIAPDVAFPTSQPLEVEIHNVVAA